jgi:hypothetical protein
MRAKGRALQILQQLDREDWVLGGFENCYGGEGRKNITFISGSQLVNLTARPPAPSVRGLSLRAYFAVSTAGPRKAELRQTCL